MFKTPLYSLFGVFLLGAASLGQWMGFGLGNVNEVRNVPKSVRENPGVYRSHYSFLPHYFGGK